MPWFSHLLVLCVFTVTHAEVKYLQFKNELEKSSTLTSRSDFASNMRTMCECVSPEYCPGYIDPRLPQDDRCFIKGERCCKILRSPYPDAIKAEKEIIHNENSLEPTVNTYMLKDDSVKYYPPIEPVLTIEQKKKQVIPLASVQGTITEKRIPWRCGQPQFQINEKSGIQEQNLDALEAEFPWTLAIFNGTNNICAASLITNELVVTAAHCIRELKIENIIVRAGEWDMNNVNELTPHQERRVGRVKIHERFDSKNYDNDIALLLLDKPLDEDLNVATICLPKIGEEVYSRCLATGWGMRTNKVSTSLQKRMKKAELDYVYFDTCENELRKTGLPNNFKLVKSAMCAKKVRNGLDMGYSDGGAPLFCKSSGEDKFVLVGISSWGTRLSPSAPVVYTSVYNQIKWLETEKVEITKKR